MKQALIATLFFANCILLATLFIAISTLKAQAKPINSFSTHNVRVIDGDTIEVIPYNKKSERVRLWGIDAPESSQVYGKESTQNLKKCIANHPITVEWKQKDKYDRLIGKIIANGIDCNLYQIEHGMAWHYKYYAKTQSKSDEKKYSQMEKIAIKNKVGLWSQAKPINPYDYRNSKK